MIHSDNSAITPPADQQSLSERSLAGLFAAQVSQTPDRPALIQTRGGERQQITYRQLDERANDLAYRLQALGVGGYPQGEIPVAIYLHRSFEFVIAVLAVIKAGGAYIPLDPAYPVERLRFILADTAAPVLLTEQALSDSLAPTSATVICVDAEQPPLAAERTAPAVVVQPDNLAYIIYTSGSTGTPKGVQISQAGLLNLIFWHQQTYQITPDDRATLLAGLGFDASVWELWPYLTAGASLYLVDDETRLDPARLLDWLTSNAITRSFLPTPLAEAVLRLPWPENSALRTLLTGGDQLRRYPEQHVPCVLVNHYGPTETSVVATAATIPPQSYPESLPPIGQPIANTQVYVLDQHLQQQAVGSVGELYIGGAGLARGYLHDPAMTAEKFVPNPFSTTPGARLYKTGDLVRLLADGNLEFVGRVDEQVKLRGLRIELGEIEAILQQHPAIREAVVLAREDPLPTGGHQEKRLVAYIVEQHEPLEPTAEPRRDAMKHVLTDGETLRAFLSARLPEHMIPSAFVLLDALPLTPNGKIDRKALPLPEQSHKLPSQPFVAPRTALEEVLAGFWCQVLGVERVGIYDNFLALGGHSLLATQVVSRVQQILRVEMQINQFFEAVTVASLAEVVRSQEPTPGHADKMAQLLRRVKGMSATDLKQSLQQKRSQ